MILFLYPSLLELVIKILKLFKKLEVFGNSDGSKKQNQGFYENKIWLKDLTPGFADETSPAI